MKPNTYFVNYCFSLNLILISLKKYASFVKKKNSVSRYQKIH